MLLRLLLCHGVELFVNKLLQFVGDLILKIGLFFKLLLSQDFAHPEER